MEHITDVMVCTDCYFAHHYGVAEVDGKLFVGDDPTPVERMPLDLLVDYELADNTDSETGEGIDEFSWSRCEGCGSPLGGSRHRLALFSHTP